MTHAEALRSRSSGVEPSDCPGELIFLDSYPDLTIDAAGRTVGRTIMVYRCADCGTRVSLVAHTGQVLNAYTFTRPGELVESLARTFALPAKSPAFED